MPRRTLVSASNSCEALETVKSSFDATLFAVPSISCNSPRAFAQLSIPGLNPLSSRMIAQTISLGISRFSDHFETNGWKGAG